MMGGYVKNDRLDDLVSACGRLVELDEGQQLHCWTVKTGLECYVFMQATIIHFYAACSMMDLACLQFESGCKDNITSWNALVAGFVRNKMMVDLARQVFNEMPERDVVSWKLFCGCSTGKMDHRKWVHDYIHDNSLPLNDNLSAALIDMYAKCGSISTALEKFHRVQDRIISISPWNAIICGLAIHGHADMSLRVFSDLQRTHIRPNSITFIGVLSACCHAGLIEQGEWYFDSMKRVYGIEPNIKHYGSWLYGRPLW
ncbi:hypothetical protein IFM89_017532 [Coptis chinensis]|uniref:Pentatricopeptide repeat-containing protein n=1 Tax=Coptis chinensis TaxID=261450 RepID=A0A835LRJ7_9MAGN|nr:hypothetical protein IFM89_017532 [Coptis chinensis]